MKLNKWLFANILWATKHKNVAVIITLLTVASIGALIAGILLTWAAFVLLPLCLVAGVLYTLVLASLLSLLQMANKAQDAMAGMGAMDMNGDIFSSLEKITKDNGLPSPMEIIQQLGLGNLTLPEEKEAKKEQN